MTPQTLRSLKLKSESLSLPVHPTTTMSLLYASVIPSLPANSPAVTPSPPQTNTTASLQGRRHHHAALSFRYKLNLSSDKTSAGFGKPTAAVHFRFRSGTVAG